MEKKREDDGDTHLVVGDNEQTLAAALANIGGMYRRRTGISYAVLAQGGSNTYHSPIACIVACTSLVTDENALVWSGIHNSTRRLLRTATHPLVSAAQAQAPGKKNSNAASSSSSEGRSGDEAA